MHVQKMYIIISRAYRPARSRAGGNLSSDLTNPARRHALRKHPPFCNCSTSELPLGRAPSQLLAMPSFPTSPLPCPPHRGPGGRDPRTESHARAMSYGPPRMLTPTFARARRTSESTQVYFAGNRAVQSPYAAIRAPETSGARPSQVAVASRLDPAVEENRLPRSRPRRSGRRFPIPVSKISRRGPRNVPQKRQSRPKTAPSGQFSPSSEQNFEHVQKIGRRRRTTPDLEMLRSDLLPGIWDLGPRSESSEEAPGQATETPDRGTEGSGRDGPDAPARGRQRRAHAPTRSRSRCGRLPSRERAASAGARLPRSGPRRARAGRARHAPRTPRSQAEWSDLPGRWG